MPSRFKRSLGYPWGLESYLATAGFLTVFLQPVGWHLKEEWWMGFGYFDGSARLLSWLEEKEKKAERLGREMAQAELACAAGAPKKVRVGAGRRI